MTDDTQVAITIIALLLFLAVLLTPFVLFFIYVFYQNSKRNRIRNRIISSYQQLIGNQRAIPVRYCCESRFKAWVKIFPWEGAGVLFPSSGNVMFLGETLSGTPLALQFEPGRAGLKWLGKCPWPNGAVSWFEFDTPTEKHYFTSETGAFVFGSNKSTKAAFDVANTCFVGSSSAGG